MKKLEVDLIELEVAFETASWDNSYFLDLETGKVIWITDEINTQLEMVSRRPTTPNQRTRWN